MGLFSKLKKVLKKTIRGVGKVIKKVTKPFRKVLRKVLKPIGRVVNKLGFIGTIALGLILPGAGAWIGQWLAGFGPNMASLVGKISTGFSNLIKPFKTVYNSVTEVFKQGFNKVGQMFGFEGPAGMKWQAGGETQFLTDSAGDFILDGAGAKIKMGTTTGKFIADAAIDAATGSVTRAATQGTLTDSISQWVNNIIGPKSKQPSASQFADVDIPEGFETQDIYDMRGEGFTTPKASQFADVDIPKGFETQDIYDMRGEGFTPKESLLTRAGKEFTKGKEWLAKKEIGSTFVSDPNWESPIGTWGQAGKGAQVAASGYGTYMAFAGGADYEPGFYNPNIDDAQGFLQESSMYSQTPMDDLYFGGDMGTPQDTFTSLANKYLSGFGQAVPQGTDPFMFAQQMPGYGYNFNSYVEDSFGGLYG